VLAQILLCIRHDNELGRAPASLRPCPIRKWYFIPDEGFVTLCQLH
jgi:hypothetical protein